MAKFKKKRSKPTPDPKTPEREPAVADSPQPTPDKEVPESDIPPTEPAVAPLEKSENSRKLNRLFWLRVALAVIAGVAATFIFEDIEGEERRWASILFMIIVFLGTIFVAKSMRMQLPSTDRKKIVTQGIGSYIFIYLFMWIVSYTFANMGSVSSGIVSPLP